MSDKRQLPGSGSRRLSTTDLHALITQLATTQAPDTDTELIDQIDALERIKSAACAAQARLSNDLINQRPTTRSDTIGATVAREVGLARRESPWTGRAKTRLARVLLHDLPNTYLALCTGDINERRAEIVATETRHLDHNQRVEADRRIAHRLAGLGDKRLAHAIRRIAQRIDGTGAAERHQRAMEKRCLTTRAQGNGTSRITAIVSDLHAATIAASLDKAAETIRRDGDSEERTRAQLIADLAAERLAGLDPLTGSSVPVAVQLVLSAETLFGNDNEPAHVRGIGPIPAAIARRAVAFSDPFRSTMRRLFTIPEDGTLVTAESTARCFPSDLRDFLFTRDDLCRTPFCNAPVRHADHINAWSRDGGTTLENGQGLCAWCNYTKEHSGWRHETTSEPYDPHEVTLTTPTGHRHRSRAPAPVVIHRTNKMETYLVRLCLADDFAAA